MSNEAWREGSRPDPRRLATSSDSIGISWDTDLRVAAFEQLNETARQASNLTQCTMKWQAVPFQIRRTTTNTCANVTHTYPNHLGHHHVDAGTTTPLVSVVMAIRNERANIVDSLGAVLDQSYPVEFTEIIVVDGDSNDGTPQLVQALFDQHPRRDLHLVHNPARIVPISLNMAIRASRGAVIVRMDGHALMDYDYITESVRALEDHGADVVGGPLETTGLTRFGEAVAYAQSSPVGIGNSQFRYSKKGAEVHTVAFGTFRRSAFERVGLFDESMVRNQDHELNARVRSTGGKVYLDPHIHASYRARATASALWRQYLQYGWWRFETLRRHPDSARPNHLLPLALVVGVLLPLPFLRTKLLRVAWGSLLATYGSFVAAGSVSQLKRGASPRDLPAIATAMMLMQIGYGVGSLLNVVSSGKWPYGPAEPTVPPLDLGMTRD